MRGLILAAAVTAIAAVLAPPAYAIECDGIALTDGCLFTITGGDTPNPDDGFAVTNADGVPLWEFVREQDLQAVGYPISQRWRDGPFTFQAFQKVILQWDPGKERMNWYNTLDALATKHPGVELPNVPPHQVLEADQGVTDFGTIVRNHLALLDANPKIKTAFLAEPNWLDLYGLPIRYEEREVDGNPQGLQVLRAQRTVFAIWNVPAPGTSLGEVVVQNVPDKIKRLSNVIIPDDAKYPSRERNLDQYVQSALERIESYSERHDTNTMEWLTQQSWFADGLDDQEKALVVAVRAFLPKDADRIQDFVDTYNLSTASFLLPLSGKINIWIYSYASFQYGDALVGMVKEAVSVAEAFLGMPFPTTDAIVVVVERHHMSFPGTAFFGTHVLYKIFGYYPERYPEYFRGSIYHEIFHHIFSGGIGPAWLIEGGANFLVSSVRRESGEESFEDQTLRLSAIAERECVEHIGVRDLQELNEFMDDYKDLVRCAYSMGELLLHRLSGIVGMDAMGSALRELYQERQAIDRRLTDEEIYQAILKHTPASKEDEVGELFRRLHGGTFTPDRESEMVGDPPSAPVKASIAELVGWAKSPPDAVHEQAVSALGTLWGVDNGLARRIAGFDWVLDGMVAKEARSLVDIAGIAQVDVSLATKVLELPWVVDDMKFWDQKAIEAIGDSVMIEPALGHRMVGQSWVADNLTFRERLVLDLLASVAAGNPDSARTLLALPWVVDGLESVELDTLISLRQLVAADGGLVGQLLEFSWIADGIDSDIESRAVEALGRIARVDAELARLIMGLAWVSDGWSDREVDTLRHLADLSRLNRDVGRHVARLPWLAAEISSEEARTIPSLRDIAAQDVESALRLAGYVWFIDDILPLERWATHSLSGLSEIDRDMARRVLDYTWFIDDINDVEAWAVYFLWRIALKDPVSARDIINYSWIVDGIEYSEYERLASWVDSLENS